MFSWYFLEALAARHKNLRVDVSGSCPVTAYLYVDDDGLILEVRINITMGVWEISQGLPPRARIWRLSRDVCGNAAASELPYSNAGGS